MDGEVRRRANTRIPPAGHGSSLHRVTLFLDEDAPCGGRRSRRGSLNRDSASRSRALPTPAPPPSQDCSLTCHAIAPFVPSVAFPASSAPPIARRLFRGRRGTSNPLLSSHFRIHLSPRGFQFRTRSGPSLGLLRHLLRQLASEGLGEDRRLDSISQRASPRCASRGPRRDRPSRACPRG
jgi:hypothetical protein